MANVKISALPAVTAVNPTSDVLPLVSGGITTKAEPQEIVNAVLPTVSASIIPTADNTFTLGTPLLRWNALYIGPGSLFLQDTNNAGLNVELTVTDGVLLIDNATQIQATALVVNTITTPTTSGNLSIGVSGDTGKAIFNRPVQITSLTGYVKANGASALTASATIPRSDVATAYGTFISDGVTTLTANINSSVTTIAVTSTTGFPSSGALLCTSEIMTYSGTTPTSFTGVVRARNGSSAAAHNTGDYISYVSTTAALGTGLVPLTTTTYSNNVSLNAATAEITVAVTGVYNVQFQGQLINCDNANDNAIGWILVNGTSVAASTGLVTTPARVTTTNGTDNLFVNAPLLSLTAGDKITFNWSSKNGSIVLATYQPIPTAGCPVVPAASVSVIQVA